MSKSRKDQRQHRKKVAGTSKGLAEHRARDKRRGRKGKKKHAVHVNKYKHLCTTSPEPRRTSDVS